MNWKKFRGSTENHRLRFGTNKRIIYLATFALIASGILTPQLSAQDYSLWNDEVEINFDTTLTTGISIRANERNKRIIGRQNGGTAYSINGDDGNLNYDKGDIVSALAKARHELEISYKNITLFARGYYYYDAAVRDGSPRHRRHDSAAKRISGFDGEFLDLYVDVDLELGDNMPLSFRVGNQILNWGESTFIQNGLNSINPINVAMLRTADASLKEALVPLPIIKANLGIGDQFSMEPFFILRWDKTEIEPIGTFFSTSDIASPGADFVALGFGRANIAPGFTFPTDNPPTSGTLAGVVPRSSDRDPSDSKEWGISMTWLEPRLEDTEFSLYFTRLHSRLPLINARTGLLSAFLSGGSVTYQQSASYFREYPDYINTFGGSFNTSIGDLALQGEVSYHLDKPLQVDDVEILLAALSPLGVPSQLGAFGFDQEIRGYRTKDVVQSQMTLTQLVDPNAFYNPKADAFVLLAEVGATWIRNMEGKNELRYEGPGSYTSGNPLVTLANIQPATESFKGFADDFSWGYRMLARATYDNAIGAVALIPQIAYSHDVQGTTPAPITNFIQERKTLTLSCKARYLNTWEANLAYTNYYGANRYNLLSDRDFLSFNLSYSF